MFVVFTTLKIYMTNTYQMKLYKSRQGENYIVTTIVYFYKVLFILSTSTVCSLNYLGSIYYVDFFLCRFIFYSFVSSYTMVII